MFHFASKGGYYLSAAFIQERPLIEHIRYFNFNSHDNDLPISIPHGRSPTPVRTLEHEASTWLTIVSVLGGGFVQSYNL